MSTTQDKPPESIRGQATDEESSRSYFTVCKHVYQEKRTFSHILVTFP
jgi:hypothetical protein